MAFDNGTIWEVNGGIGDDTNNGGGFSPACAGFAIDGAASSANTASPVFTSTSYNFVSADEGHYLFIQSGDFSKPGWWLIVSTAGNAATLDAAIGAGVLYNGATPTNITTGISNPVATLTDLVWGVDYSRSASPRIAYTDMLVGATTTQFTSVLKPVGKNIIGNVIKVTSGATVQRVEVVSTATTTATCDKTLGTAAQVGVGGLGGCVATPGIAAGVITGIGLSGMFVKGSNTYSLSASTNVAGGSLSPTGGTHFYCGYSTNRYLFNTDANRPVFQSSANSVVMIKVNGASCSCHCIDFENGNSNTSVTGYDDGDGWGNDYLWNCKFKSISIAAKISTTSIMEWCWVDSCTGVTMQGSIDRTFVRNCVFTSNASLSFTAAGFSGNVFYANGSNSSGLCGGGRFVERCLFYGTTGNNSICVASTTLTVTNCIFYSNAASGAVAINVSGTDNTNAIINCAFGANTADITTGSSLPGFRIVGKITLTGDPCVAASSGNFALNSTAGAGALLKATGFPVTFANGLTTNGLDVGPAQTVAGTSGATAYAF